MIVEEQTATFVWRCPDCKAAYGGECLPFLHTDEVSGYCTCGGRLVEGVASVEERRYRLVVPSRLLGSQLHRDLRRKTADDDRIEVAEARQGDRLVALFNCWA
jgi:hypothetical protein